MIVMALICVLGLIALAIVSAFFLSIRGSRLAAVAHAVDEEVAHKLRRGEEIDGTLADALENGLSVDHALADFQKSRADVLTVPGRTSAPWNWNKDDVAKFRASEFTRRSEEVNRRLVVPAVTTSLLVVALTVSTIAVNYGFFSANAVESPTAQPEAWEKGASPSGPGLALGSQPWDLPLEELQLQTPGAASSLDQPPAANESEKHQAPIVQAPATPAPNRATE